MTNLQRTTMRLVFAAHLRGEWYRAGNGERVTLASLFRAGALERRAWRRGKSESDNAYEYRPSQSVLDALRGEP